MRYLALFLVMPLFVAGCEEQKEPAKPGEDATAPAGKAQEGKDNGFGIIKIDHEVAVIVSASDYEISNQGVVLGGFIAKEAKAHKSGTSHIVFYTAGRSFSTERKSYLLTERDKKSIMENEQAFLVGFAVTRQ